jgi:putative transposase
VQQECLDHFVVFGESHLRYLISEFLAHYHLERPHQGLGNRTLSGADPSQALALTSGEIECRERLGGLLKHFRRKVA